MDTTALRQGIDDLYAAYADCIDDDRLEAWPDFFVEDCRYLITSRDSHAAGMRHGIIYCASRGMVEDRVMAMRRANIFEPHRYRHIVGPARLGKIEGGVAEARANFLVVRIMHDGESRLFATGRYLDRIAVASQPFRFIGRTVVLDSQKIDTLLVIPL
ncbi:MAG TPA: aromatic-ring-hydroxylating dioxygenase subunit beta [Stellaceae bacterium]|nr:aromatic-ring-hydroxylating dioxygenase subunit beta [Stellaceae bacterium]